ncbi:MAG: TraB/GumN family protein, partial [Burkholderiales bacterium]
MLLLQRLLAILLLCIATGALRAEQKPAAGAVERFERGLLWRIDKPGITPSYVFGTIHIDDPRVLKLPPAVTRA